MSRSKKKGLEAKMFDVPERVDATYLFDDVSRRAGVKPDHRNGRGLMALCLADARRYPLLSRDEERKLFQELEVARDTCATLIRIAVHVGEDTMQYVLALYLLCDEKVQELTTHAVCANMLFGVSMAYTFRNAGLEPLDLIQETYLGLLRATETFEWRRGTRFITHAFHQIRAVVSHAVSDQSRTIRFPMHVHEDVSRMETATRRFLKASGGVAPTDEQLAAALGWPLEKVEKVQRDYCQQQMLSLNAPIRSHSSRSNPDGAEFGDFVEDVGNPGPEEQAVSTLMGEKVHALLPTLSPWEAEIICRRFGIGYDEETLAEIGQRLRLSRERVRQIERRALGLLKECLGE